MGYDKIAYSSPSLSRGYFYVDDMHSKDAVYDAIALALYVEKVCR